MRVYSRNPVTGKIKSRSPRAAWLASGAKVRAFWEAVNSETPPESCRMSDLRRPSKARTLGPERSSPGHQAARQPAEQSALHAAARATQGHEE